MRRELKGLKRRGWNDGGADRCCKAMMGDGGASAITGGGVTSVAMDGGWREKSGILALAGGEAGMRYGVERERNGIKGKERGDNGAECCCAAAMGDGGVSTATADDGVASVATDGCTGWMGGGELSGSRLRLGLVAMFCSATLGSSACCSGSGSLFWWMSVWLDGRIGLAPTLEREMCSYLAELAGRDLSVSGGG